jgi:hypothetical protein
MNGGETFGFIGWTVKIGHTHATEADCGDRRSADTELARRKRRKIGAHELSIGTEMTIVNFCQLSDKIAKEGYFATETQRTRRSEWIEVQPRVDGHRIMTPPRNGSRCRQTPNSKLRTPNQVNREGEQRTANEPENQPQIA